MILGAVMFAIGAIMTFSGNKTKVESTSVKTQTTVIDKQVPAVEEQSPISIKEPSSADKDSKKKGNDFEDYVANVLNSNSLTIKEWNKGTVTDEGAFSENALNPDMFVSDQETKINLNYWIECKFRSDLGKGGFRLKDYQMERYSDIQKSSKRKILIALGVGGSASNPERFYVIPLDSLKRFKHIPDKYLSHYVIENPRQNLRKHIRDYFFNDVFKKDKK